MLFRNGDGLDAHLGQPFPDRRRVILHLAVKNTARLAQAVALLEEAADLLAKLLLFGRKVEIHLSPRSCPRGCGSTFSVSQVRTSGRNAASSSVSSKSMRFP